jgi:hypothetical protein
MSFTEEQKALIKTIAREELVSTQLCDEKMGNMEGDMKGLDKKIGGVSKQSWAIIFLLFGILIKPYLGI